MSTFPVTSVTLIAKIKNLAPGEDSAAWVRFWNSYSAAIRQFAAMKGGEENADDIVMQVLGKLVNVLREGKYTPEKGKFGGQFCDVDWADGTLTVTPHGKGVCRIDW